MPGLSNIIFLLSRILILLPDVSDTDKNIFDLVNSEGNKITKEKQLGLLLYRGGTVCSAREDFSYNAADAICKEMNFTRAERWTTKESFDIQSNYDVIINNVRCDSEEWESCRFSEYSTHCEHIKDVFLSCSGKQFIESFKK